MQPVLGGAGGGGMRGRGEGGSVYRMANYISVYEVA